MKRTHSLSLFSLIASLALALLFTTPARSDTRIEKSLKLDPGGRFVLESDVGSVTITGTKEPGARVVVTSNRDDFQELFDLRFEEGKGEARVTAHKKSWVGFPKHVSAHFEILVPSETSPEIRTGGGGIKAYGLKGEPDLRTSGGSIEVTGLTGSLSAHTSGGGIALHEVTGTARIETSGGGIEVASLEGSLHANTSGGPIRVEKVTGDIAVETSGGPIHVEGVGGRVVARTSGGSVEVSFDRGNARGGEVETSGGSIRVLLDPGANLNLDASASGGGVTSDLPVRVVGHISSSSLHGTLGSGGETLRLHTSGGSIHIQAR